MTPSNDALVVALGGNALAPETEEGNVYQQFARSRVVCAELADLVAAGQQLVVTHGNGPQVGNVLRRVELAAGEVYPLPLGFCVAHTQGGMGYMLAQVLTNALQRRDIDRKAYALITSVVVDSDDPELTNPSKPIGRALPPEIADELRRYHWHLEPTRDGRLRRVVPSPRPREIVEIDLIRRLVDAGELLVVGGGGGMPVIRDRFGGYHGVEAVVDKDRTSAILAIALNAKGLLIQTGVSRVKVNFGKPGERDIERMTLAEAERYHAEGQFPPGSMGPKVEAAIHFLRSTSRPDARVIICALGELQAAQEGHAGTWIVPNSFPAQQTNEPVGAQEESQS